jgi:hypothetical protein
VTIAEKDKDIATDGVPEHQKILPEDTAVVIGIEKEDGTEVATVTEDPDVHPKKEKIVGVHASIALAMKILGATAAHWLGAKMVLL